MAYFATRKIKTGKFKNRKTERRGAGIAQQFSQKNGNGSFWWGGGGVCVSLNHFDFLVQVVEKHSEANEKRFWSQFSSVWVIYLVFLIKKKYTMF